MAQITWTEEAQQWLRDIHDYIPIDNPASAHSTVLNIYLKAQLLATYPELGYRYEVTGARDIRILLYGHYRIAYLIRTEGNIEILGVSMGHSTFSVTSFNPGFLPSPVQAHPTLPRKYFLIFSFM